MKQIILVMIVLGMPLGLGVYAQQGSSVFGSDGDAHVAIGVKSGLGFNWASSELGQPSAGLLPKGYIGAFAEYAFMPYLALQTDFMAGLHHGFKRQGFQLTWTTMDFDLMVKGRLPVGRYFVFTLASGLSLSTGVGALTLIEDGQRSKITYADYSLNAVGMGMVVELGVEFNLPNNMGYVGTSFRMDWKFNPLYKPLEFVEEFRPRGSVHTPIGLMLFYGYRWQMPRMSAFR